MTTTSYSSPERLAASSLKSCSSRVGSPAAGSGSAGEPSAAATTAPRDWRCPPRPSPFAKDTAHQGPSNPLKKKDVPNRRPPRPLLQPSLEGEPIAARDGPSGLEKKTRAKGRMASAWSRDGGDGPSELAQSLGIGRLPQKGNGVLILLLGSPLQPYHCLDNPLAPVWPWHHPSPINGGTARAKGRPTGGGGEFCS
jgi:hypothetical protein